MGIVIQEIGTLHTDLTDPKETPIQSSRSTLPGIAEIFPEYAEGLEGIAEFSHLYLIYQLHHMQEGSPLRVKPFLDDRLHGVFATRFPARPNRIGLSIVRLVRQEGNRLHFFGADMLEGTPLVDIKPYIPEFDVFEVEKIGWYQNRKYS